MWRERGLESEKSSYLYIEAFPFISPSFLLQSSQGVVFISGALQCQCHLILICANDSPSSIEDQQSALRFEEQINIYVAQASLAQKDMSLYISNLLKYQTFLSRLWLANVFFRKYSFTGTRQTQACMMKHSLFKSSSRSLSILIVFLLFYFLGCTMQELSTGKLKLTQLE